MLCAETPRQGIDFRKHYRSDAPHLLDTDYAVAKAFGARSWPTFVLVDAEGNIAARGHSIAADNDDGKALLATIERLLPSAKGGPPKGARCDGDRCIVVSDDTEFEVTPTLARDGAGRLHLVYVREKGGRGTLMHRVCDDTGDWAAPQRVASVMADQYAPHLCADGDSVRLVWCSNSAASGKYDVYTARWADGVWSAPERVVETDDDAARPQCVMDAKGNFWVAYYRWIPWGVNYSRDREVFARCRTADGWGEPTQLSPQDVPRYEDSADPGIAADEAGNVWVAWSWDTHPDNYAWPYPPTFGCAIFTRQLRAGQVPSKLMMVGVRAASMREAKRHAAWSFMPAVACQGDKTWFAFAAHQAMGGDHTTAVTKYDAEAGGFPAPQILGANDAFTGAPVFAEAPDGRMAVVWSARAGATHSIHASILEEGGQWSTAKPLWADPEANLFTPAAVVGADGKLWIAAVRTTLGGSTVEVKPIDLVPPKALE